MDSNKQKFTIDILLKEAKKFAERERLHSEPTIYRATDGKAVGTYLENKLRLELSEKYSLELGNAAKGIDFPDINVDFKTTSSKQPQSSCPFKSARQKIYGLGYGLLVFVYDKVNDDTAQTSTLDICDVIYVEEDRTADFQLTSAILNALANNANTDDITAIMYDRKLPVDDIAANQLAEEIIKNPPKQGYLTISNALQWRLQYKRVIDEAGSVSGVVRVF